MKEGEKTLKKLSKCDIEYVLFDRRPRTKARVLRRKIKLEEVVQFLKDSAQGHVAFYQYTSIASLQKMLRSKMLHLTLAKHLNDQLEYQTCDPEKWGSCYLACFSFGQVENMGMWKMYGRRPEDAVRISFPGKYLRKSIQDAAKGKLFVAELSTGKKKFKYVPYVGCLEGCSLHDVMYEYGRRYELDESGRKRRGTMLWNRKMAIDDSCPDLDNYRKHPEFATYVKDVLWAYENESRLVMQCKNSEVLPDILAIDVSMVLPHITVQLGPNFKGGVERAKQMLGASVDVKSSRYRVLQA